MKKERITESNPSGRVSPSLIDVHVGNRLRSCRHMRGIGREQLGNLVKLTYQQVQKYETGANRISAGRLFVFAKVLKVPVGYFFEGLADEAMSDAA